MRYLKKTKHYGLLYSRSKSEKCFGYSDSDYAGDLDDRKSTSGYLFKLAGAAISWRSKKQSTVALSTAEAEYVALSSATQEALWLNQLITELKKKPEKPMVIHEDNQAAMSMAKNPQYHEREKHIDIKVHFVRDNANKRTIELEYCQSTDMVADMLTKGLPRNTFDRLRDMAGVLSMN